MCATFVTEVQNLDKKRGSEQTLKLFRDYYAYEDLIHEFTNLYKTQQYGVAEKHWWIG